MQAEELEEDYYWGQEPEPPLESDDYYFIRVGNSVMRVNEHHGTRAKYSTALKSEKVKRAERNEEMRQKMHSIAKTIIEEAIVIVLAIFIYLIVNPFKFIAEEIGDRLLFWYNQSINWISYKIELLSGSIYNLSNDIGNLNTYSTKTKGEKVYRQSGLLNPNGSEWETFNELMDKQFGKSWRSQKNDKI